MQDGSGHPVRDKIGAAITCELRVQSHFVTRVVPFDKVLILKVCRLFFRPSASLDLGTLDDVDSNDYRGQLGRFEVHEVVYPPINACKTKCDDISSRDEVISCPFKRQCAGRTRSGHIIITLPVVFHAFGKLSCASYPCADSLTDLDLICCTNNLSKVLARVELVAIKGTPFSLYSTYR